MAKDDIAYHVEPFDIERLMSIFDGTSVGVSLTNARGRVLRQNAAAADILGYAPSELEGRSWTEVTYSDDIAVDWSLLQELLAGRRTHYRLEKRYLHKDGHIVWARLSVSKAANDVNGEPLTLAIVEDITEQKLAEQAFVRSRDQLEIVLQSVDDGITVQGLDGSVIYANAAAARLLGADSPDAVALTSSAELSEHYVLIREDGSPLSFRDLPGRRVLATGEPAEDVVGFRRSNDKDIQWSIVRARPVRDGEGRLVGAVNAFVDITERKRSEYERTRHLEREEEMHRRLAFLAEVSQILASSLDYEETLSAVARLAVPQLADWCLVHIVEEGTVRQIALAHVDPARVQLAQEIQKRYPYDPDALSGIAAVLKTRTSRLMTEISPELLAQSLEDQEFVEILKDLQFRSSMIVPLLARGRAIGAITLISAESGRNYSEDDLTMAEDLAARAALAMDNARLYRESTRAAAQQEAVLTQMAEGVTIVDPTGTILFTNDAGRQILGSSGPGHDIGDYVDRVDLRNLDGDVVSRDDMRLARALGGEVIVREEWMARHSDGRQLILQGSASPVYDREGMFLGAVLTFRDVTAERELDRQKDEFLSLVGHELRTPLTVLRGYLQVLQRREIPREIDQPLEIMARQTDQIVGLVNDLLDLSRMQSGRLECVLTPLDYGGFVEAVIDELRLLHPDRPLGTHIPPHVRVLGDTMRLRQVLVNLIDNALHYGPANSEVRITVEESDDAVITYVCDAGPPLPPEEREKVFERFYRRGANSSRAGLGIGLYVTRGIVEAHGGRIWMEDDDHLSVAYSLQRVG